MEFIKHDFVVSVVKSLARASWSLTSKCARTELDWQRWNSITRLGGYDVQQRQVPARFGETQLGAAHQRRGQSGKTRDGVKVAVRVPPPLDSQRVECAPTAAAGF